MSTTYLKPTDDIVNIVDVPLSPSLSLSPCGKYMALWDRPPLKSIVDMSAKEFKVAGKRLSKYFTRSLLRSSFSTGISVARLPKINDPLAGAEPLQTRQVSSLGKGMFGYHRWNQAGDLLCFCRLYTTPPNEGLRLFLLNPNTLEVYGPLTVDDAQLPLSASLGSPLCWFNNRQLLCRVATHAGEPIPESNPVPSGPDTQEHSSKKKKKVRSYQDLIKSDDDEKLFRHLGTSHLVLVTIDLKEGGGLTISHKKLVCPALYNSMRVSPNKEYILLARYSSTSRIVPYHRFGNTTSLYRYDSAEQQLSFVRCISELAVADQVPLTHNSCRTGKRFSFWSEGHDALLVSVRALDGGDGGADAEFRDELLCQSPVDDFATETRIARTELRWRGMDFFDDGKTAILSESWWHTKTYRRWLCTLDSHAQMIKKEVLVEHSSEDRYARVGSFLYVTSKRGTQTPVQVGPNGRTLLLTNTLGASVVGNVPYADVLHLDGVTAGPRQKEGIKYGCTRRFWTSNHEEKQFQKLLDILPSPPGCARLDPAATTIRAIMSTETTDTPTNYFLCDIDIPVGAKGGDDNTFKAATGLVKLPHIPLTHRCNPYPGLKGYIKRIITYPRADGVILSGTLYLPPGYDETDPDRPLLPLLMWAYPREFKSPAAASRLRDSPHRFSTISPTSPLVWLTRGYAVLEGPAMPVVAPKGGKPSEANDTFVEQLVASAQAAVHHCCQTLAICDPDKVVVGGRSYGAFMTANLLIHAHDLFSCGIACSGAFNRTLTPFGFQAEERTLWEAPHIYNGMSPFMHVSSKMSPLLLIHGCEDENSGTWPDQSRRMFAACQGHGVISRLVMLPKESHFYRARENILHCLAETQRWMQRHCLDGKPLRRRTDVSQKSTVPDKKSAQSATVCRRMMVMVVGVMVMVAARSWGRSRF